MKHLYVGAVFFAAAFLVSLSIWLLLHIMGAETAITLIVGALAFGAGAALVDYLTERR